jgi:uridylate kinase
MDDPLKPKYRRVLLKLSGEVFGYPEEKDKPKRFGINLDSTLNIARQIKSAAARGVELAIVVGGGNILRGSHFSAHAASIKEQTAHYMGMLATILNGMALQDALESLSVETRLQTAIRMEAVAEPYIRRRCVRHLEKKRVVILAGGTGNPFVTTDSAAALRARELEAEILLKATKVNKICAEDPEINQHAIPYDRLTHSDLLRNNLKIMDAGAVTACLEGKMKILVFSYKTEGNIEKAIAGYPGLGTLVETP